MLMVSVGRIRAFHPGGAGGMVWSQNWDAGFMPYRYIGGNGGHPSYPDSGWYPAYFPLWTTENIGPTPSFNQVVPNASVRPLMWDISCTAAELATVRWTTLPPRGNHANNDGTGRGINILFVDGHMQWRSLNHGTGQLFAQDALPSYSYW